MKVLIIENDSFTRTVYESDLHQQNLEVVLAADGEDGLEKAKKEKPDLILMDLILTKKNGFQVIEELKKDAKFKSIPIVVCSALSQQADIDEAIKLGATKYLSKEDFSQKQVIEQVLNVLMSM